jgi:hypothetical protein
MIFDHVPDFLQGYEILAEETLAVSTTSVPLAAVPAASVGELKAVIITINDADVNLTMITAAAVADTDHFIPSGGLRCITDRKQIAAFEVIRNAAADAILGALYIGTPAVVTS